MNDMVFAVMSIRKFMTRVRKHIFSSFNPVSCLINSSSILKLFGITFAALTAAILIGFVRLSWAIPGPLLENCKVAPSPCSSDQERWVWKQIYEGKDADLQKHYGGPGNPEDAGKWPPERLLTANFLQEILNKEPYRSSIPRKGITIIGARIDDPIDLTETKVEIRFVLHRSFLQKLTLDYAEFELLDLAEGKVIEKLSAERLKVTKDLLLGNGIFSTIDLVGAHIGGQLELVSATVGEDLDLNNIWISENLFLGQNQQESVIRNGERSVFKNIDLRGGHIEGQLDMTGATVSGTLKMNKLDIGNDLIMRKAELRNSAALTYINVGGNIDLSESIGELPTIDLTGAKIEQSLVLGSSRRSPSRWQENAGFILRNVSVREIQDRCEGYSNKTASNCKVDPWPKHLVLEGFTFKQLGALEVDADSNMSGRTPEWWKMWLSRNQPYSPQPYHMVATVFRNLGQPDKADNILYASKNSELGVSAWKPPWRKIRLYLEWAFIGYGYKMWRACYWIIGFIVLGVSVLRCSGEGERNHLPYGIAFSIDMLLPIIRLREKHYEIDITGWARYYFYLHKMMGYVLASFLIAGLTGLTKG